MDNDRQPSILPGVIAGVLIALGICGVALTLHLVTLIDAWATIPERIAQLQSTVEALPAQVATPLTDAVLARLDKETVFLNRKVDILVRQVDLTRHELLGDGGHIDRLRATTFDVASMLSGQIGSGFAAIETDLQPTLAAAPKLMDRYRLLPDDVGLQLQPSFLALQPEITCRQNDGTGYGGCWHSRVTALMGEAARAGGVFVQHFPEFSSNVTGITQDFHTLTSKAVAPDTKWGKVRKAVTTASLWAQLASALGLF